MSIGLTTRFKNRLFFLKNSLPTWCALQELSCITIMDWDSDENVIPLVDSMQDSRIQVLRVDKRRWFEPGICHNVAIRNTKTDYICAMDCDIQIIGNFSNVLKQIDMRSFITSPEIWRAKVDGVYGSCIFPKKMWIELNGYVEGQTGWAVEDSNFYARAIQAGYRRKETMGLNIIKHQPHSDAFRLKYFPFKVKYHKGESRRFNEKWIKTIDIKKQKQQRFKGRIYKNGRWSAQEL